MSKICSKCQKVCLNGALKCPICDNNKFTFKAEGDNMVFGLGKGKDKKEKGKDKDFECKINFKTQEEPKAEPKVEVPKVEVPKAEVTPIPEKVIEQTPEIKSIPREVTPLIEVVRESPVIDDRIVIKRQENRIVNIEDILNMRKPPEEIVGKIHTTIPDDDVIKVVAFDENKGDSMLLEDTELPSPEPEPVVIKEVAKEVAKPSKSKSEQKAEPKAEPIEPKVESVKADEEEALYDVWQRRRLESTRHPVLVKFAEPLQIIMVSPIEVNSNVKGSIETAVKGVLQNEVNLKGGIAVKGEMKNSLSGNVDGTHVVRGQMDTTVKGDINTNVQGEIQTKVSGEVNTNIAGDIDVRTSLTIPELQGEIMRIRDGLNGKPVEVEVPEVQSVTNQDIIDEQRKTQYIVFIAMLVIVLALLLGLGVI